MLEMLTFTFFSNGSKEHKSKDKSPNAQPALPAPEEERDQRAWIKGITICTWILASVFIVNIILTIIASVIAYTNTPTPSRISYAALYTGSCATTKSWTTGLHLLINVLSTILLAAGNYCMQCLASPSRGQVDAAHSKREWVRIGGPDIWGLLWGSLTNHKGQKATRWVLGWVSLATSLPVHLMLVLLYFGIS